ncbi:MAG: outer membrane protein [Planctomycetota bacterium]|jgi:outer membrane protein
MIARPILVVLASYSISATPFFAHPPAQDVAAITTPDTAKESAVDEREQRAEKSVEGVLELSLDDAVRIVLEQNLELRLEELNTEIARFNALGQWGAFDPIYTLSANYTESTNEPFESIEGANPFKEDSRDTQQALAFPLLSGGSLDLAYTLNNRNSDRLGLALNTSTNANLSLTLRQPLLRGAWSTYSTSLQRIAEADYAKASESRRETRQNLVLRVHEAYWNLVEAIEIVDVRALSLQLGQEQLDQDRRRLEVGVGTEVDVLQAETNIATNEEQLLLAQVEAEAAMDVLKSLLFHRNESQEWNRYLNDWETPIIPLTHLPDVVPSINQVWTRSLGRALEMRTELVQQRIEIQAQSLRLLRSESDSLPRMDLSLSASNRGFSDDFTDSINDSFGSDLPTYTAGLSFEVPVFNRSARNARRGARIGLQSAQLRYESIEQDVVSDVRARVRDVNYRRKAVQASQKSLQLAERQLQAEQARYREGLSTTFQLLQFQEDLAQALSTEKATRAAFARAVASLQRSEGWIGEKSSAK